MIESERLLLRYLKKSDLRDMHELSCIPEVEKFNTMGIPDDISVTKAILKDRIHDNKRKNPTYMTFAVIEKTSKKFIGLFGIVLGAPKYKKAELWYKYHPDFWNKGMATEAVNAALDYCFDTLGLHRVEAGCAVENLASVRVIEKVGMKFEGTARQILPLESGWADGHSYAILNTDDRNQ